MRKREESGKRQRESKRENIETRGRKRGKDRIESYSIELDLNSIRSIWVNFTNIWTKRLKRRGEKTVEKKRKKRKPMKEVCERRREKHVSDVITHQEDIIVVVFIELLSFSKKEKEVKEVEEEVRREEEPVESTVKEKIKRIIVW